MLTYFLHFCWNLVRFMLSIILVMLHDYAADTELVIVMIMIVVTM